MEIFNNLVVQYSPMIYKIIRTLHLYKDKDEYYQIGLIGLWEAQQKYSPDFGPFLPFAYTVVRGRMLNQLKKEGKWDHYHSLSDCLGDSNSNTSFHSDRYLELDSFLSYCHSLTVNQLRWVMSSIYEGKKIEEISMQYHVTKDTVKSWRKGALKKLKEEILKE